MYSLLQGLRVVECASFIAAPSCTLHMLQMGAQVIRIDPVGGGPDYHRWPVSREGASFYWEGLNKGKLSVAVNFGTPEGRALVGRLIGAPGDAAGLFVTNFPTEGFLSHARLREQRDDLISVRIMGWADGATAVDYTVNAAVGVPAMTGPRGSADAPVNHVLPAWDLVTGAYAAFALLAAHRHRQQTGAGQEVRVPLADVAMASLANIGQVAEVLDGGDRPRMGNQLFGAFGRDFQTADAERLMVVAITPRQWSGLVVALGLENAVCAAERAAGVSFARDEGLRFQYSQLLVPLVEEAIAKRKAEELARAFNASGVCWSVYRSLASAIRDDPRLVANNPLFSPVTHSGGRTYPTPGAPASLPSLARKQAERAPRLGENTDEVLRRLLDLSPTEIGRLHDAGHIAGAE